MKMDAELSKQKKIITAIQREQKYYFKFLSPTSYGIFFKMLREKTYGDFKLEIEARLTG